MNILAIDQGTSGTKAVVADTASGLEIIAVAEHIVRPDYLAAGRVEQDPAELLASVLAAGREAAEAANRAGRPVQAVALANQGETVLAWDPDTGRPLTTALSWQDRRAESVCAELADRADEIAARTGLMLDPYFSAPKMAWLRRHLTSEGVVTTTDTWLVHQLTGAFVTDVSTASRSLLFGLDDLAWLPELVDAFGLTGERFPELVDNDQIVGETQAFGPALPLAGLVVDQQAALFGQGCLQPGQAKCTFGTGAFLLANTGGTGVRSRSGLTSSVAWRVRDDASYCLDGQLYTAGSAVRWLVDLGLLERPADLDAVAAPESDGAICVPAFAGLAAPWWRPEATATFTGVRLSTGRGELVRAVVEGLAATVAELADLMGAEAGTPLASLRVDGGLTGSAVLMQSTADLLQIPVEVYAGPHATAVGAAALAVLALNDQLTPDQAVGDPRPARTYTPTWAPDRAAEFRDRWRVALSREGV